MTPLPALIAQVQPHEPVLLDIAKERERQDAKWGGPEHDDTHTANNWTVWLDLIDEHRRKAWTEDDLYTSYPNARHRLIETAALAVAAVESIDRTMGYERDSVLAAALKDALETLEKIAAMDARIPTARNCAGLARSFLERHKEKPA